MKVKIDGSLTEKLEKSGDINLLPRECLENTNLVLEWATEKIFHITSKLRNAGFNGQITLQSNVFGEAVDASKIVSLIKKSFTPTLHKKPTRTVEHELVA